MNTFHWNCRPLLLWSSELSIRLFVNETFLCSPKRFSKDPPDSPTKLPFKSFLFIMFLLALSYCFLLIFITVLWFKYIQNMCFLKNVANFLVCLPKYVLYNCLKWKIFEIFWEIKNDNFRVADKLHSRLRIFCCFSQIQYVGSNIWKLVSLN